MSGTDPGWEQGKRMAKASSFLWDLRITKEDIELFPANRVYLRQVLDVFDEEEIKEGIPVSDFYQLMSKPPRGMFPFHRPLSEYVDKGQNEFARHVVNLRRDSSDRREWMWMAAMAFFGVGTGVFLANERGEYTPPPIIDHSAEEAARDEEYKTQVVASFLTAYTPAQRRTLVDSVDKFSKWTDTLEERLSNPDWRRGKQNCKKSADMLWGYRCAVGQQTDYLLKELNISLRDGRYHVVFSEDYDLIKVAVIAKAIHSLNPKQEIELQDRVIEFTDMVHAAERNYLEVRGLLLSENLTYEQSGDFHRLAGSVLEVSKGYKSFRTDIDKILKKGADRIASK